MKVADWFAARERVNAEGPEERPRWTGVDRTEGRDPQNRWFGRRKIRRATIQGSEGGDVGGNDQLCCFGWILKKKRFK